MGFCGRALAGLGRVQAPHNFASLVLFWLRSLPNWCRVLCLILPLTTASIPAD